MKKVHHTLAWLRKLQEYRKKHVVSYLTDPQWLVEQAINRRGGWPDDPGCSRGTCTPVNGKYPRKAIGESMNHLRCLAHYINTPRVIVRECELGEWRRLLMSRIPHRITTTTK